MICGCGGRGEGGGVRWGEIEEEANIAPYRDKQYHTLSNGTRKAKNFTSR